MMTTFINLSVKEPFNWKLFFRHLEFFSIWVVGICIILFRIDLALLKEFGLNEQWLQRIGPYVYLIIVILILIITKWYYSTALIFYPILFVFWFLPKLILAKGKIYLFQTILVPFSVSLKNSKGTTSSDPLSWVCFIFSSDDEFKFY